MSPLLSVLALISLVFLSYIVAMNFLKQRSQLDYLTRLKYDLETFINHFSEQGISENLSNNVYHYLQKIMNRSDFRPMPTDDLHRIYGLAEEDLEETVVELAQECGCSLPTSENVSGMPIDTVEHLVQLLWRLYI